MSWLFLKHPETSKPDLMTTLLTVVTYAAVLKFVLDGVTLVVSGHSISFGHMDPIAYGTLLAPVLSLHGWLEKTKSDQNKDKT